MRPDKTPRALHAPRLPALQRLGQLGEGVHQRHIPVAVVGRAVASDLGRAGSTSSCSAVHCRPGTADVAANYRAEHAEQQGRAPLQCALDQRHQHAEGRKVTQTQKISRPTF